MKNKHVSKLKAFLKKTKAKIKMAWKNFKRSSLEALGFPQAPKKKAKAKAAVKKIATNKKSKGA